MPTLYLNRVHTKLKVREVFMTAIDDAMLKQFVKESSTEIRDIYVRERNRLAKLLVYDEKSLADVYQDLKEYRAYEAEK